MNLIYNINTEEINSESKRNFRSLNFDNESINPLNRWKFKSINITYSILHLCQE